MDTKRMRSLFFVIGLVFLSLYPNSLICSFVKADEINFEDVTASAGINYVGQSKGSAWGDFNGDGWPDLWVTNRYNEFQLYVNNGDGTFSDGSAAIAANYNDAYAAAWADFDNDGDMDIFNIGPGQLGVGSGNPNVFLVNEDGLLNDKTSEYGVEYSSGRGRTPLWFDWNNDGSLDLLMANIARPDGDAATALFTQENGGFTDTTFEASISSESSQFAQITRLAANSPPYLFLHGVWGWGPLGIYDYAALPFQDKKESLNFPITSGVMDVIMADFDGDLLTDFFLSRANTFAAAAEQIDPQNIYAGLWADNDQKAIRFKSTGDVTFWIYGNLVSVDEVFVGAGGFHPNSLPFALSITDPGVSGIYPHEPGTDAGIFIGFEPNTGYWEVQLSAPVWSRIRNFIIEAPQLSDLETVGFTSSDGEKTDKLIVQTANGFTDEAATAGLADPNPCASAVAGDFDNDMDLDIYLVCQGRVQNRPNLLYENDGNGSFSLVANAGGAAGGSAGRGDTATTVDFDQDGFLDLLVTNGLDAAPFHNGPHQLFRNLGNQNDWIQIDLVGVRANRDAVGAQVLATAGGVTQIREQNAGMHLYSQNHQRLHFGLGENTLVENLTVFWPNGTVQEILSLPANQIVRVLEPSFPSPFGLPGYIVGVDTGVYIWKNSFDGPYFLRVLGNGPHSTFSVKILADQPFVSVEPVRLENNDDLSWSDNYLTFTSRLTSGQDGIDFVLPPGTEALISVEQDGVPNPRQLHIGSSEQPLTPAGWIFPIDELSSLPNFQPGVDLGLFMGAESVPGQILLRWNGDGYGHAVNLKIVSSDIFQDIQTVSFESCCDSLITDARSASASATMSTWWDGLDIQVPPDSALGISYHLDGLFQSHRFHHNAPNLGEPNAYALPLADISGNPIFQPAQDKGLFVWKDENDILHLRVTAGGSYGNYNGVIVSSLPVISAQAWSLEPNDTLEVSVDKKRITFDLTVWQTYQDGIDIMLTEGSQVSLELNGNTAEAAGLVNLGGERWPVETLPVVVAN